MSDEYFHWFYLSLNQEWERKRVLDVYAEIHGIMITTKWSREKLSKKIRRIL